MGIAVESKIRAFLLNATQGRSIRRCRMIDYTTSKSKLFSLVIYRGILRNTKGQTNEQRQERNHNSDEGNQGQGLDCCCNQHNEVKLCTAKDCALWPFRLGHSPFRAKRELTEEQKRKVAETFAKAKAKRVAK